MPRHHQFGGAAYPHNLSEYKCLSCYFLSTTTITTSRVLTIIHHCKEDLKMDRDEETGDSALL